MTWILFYYNSLPDMPAGCKLSAQSRKVMHRDFFRCNPSNTGHYQYPKFETMSYDDKCHGREVRKFLTQPDPEKYVVFYTRHTSRDGSCQNKLVGYFKVGRVNKEKRGFTASDRLLLPKDWCVNLAYAARGVPVSWGRSSARADVDNFLQRRAARLHADISSEYQEGTKAIMSKLITAKGRSNLVKDCVQCSVKNSCFWGQLGKEAMTARLKKLYGREEKC